MSSFLPESGLATPEWLKKSMHYILKPLTTNATFLMSRIGFCSPRKQISRDRMKASYIWLMPEPSAKIGKRFMIFFVWWAKNTYRKRPTREMERKVLTDIEPTTPSLTGTPSTILSSMIMSYTKVSLSFWKPYSRGWKPERRMPISKRLQTI